MISKVFLLLLSSLLFLLVSTNFVVTSSEQNQNLFPFSAEIITPIYNNEGQVKVSWQSVPPSNISDPDWISVWWQPFPATYIQYVNVSSSSSSGSYTFTNLLNARHPYIFQYFRGNTSLAQSEPILPVPHIPMQIRLSLVLNDEQNEDMTGSTKMRVTWTSDRVNWNSCVVFSSRGVDPSLPINTNSPPVPLEYWAFVDGNISTYNASELNQLVQLPPIAQRTSPFENINYKGLRCGWMPPPFNTTNPPQTPCWDDVTATELFVDPGLFLSVELYNLQPGMRYYYQVGECPSSSGANDGILSQVRSFVAKPLSSNFIRRSTKNSLLSSMDSKKKQKLSSSTSTNQNVNVIFFADVGTGPVESGFEGGALHNDIRMKVSDGQAGAKFVIQAIQQKMSQIQQESSQDPSIVPISLAILGGDISYSRGWSFISESFHNLTSNGLFDSMTAQMVIGNHGRDTMVNPFKLAACTDSGGESGLVLGRRFFGNMATDAFLKKPYYYFRYGPVFFIMLSTEHKCEEQASFVQEAVSNSSIFDRSITPWLVVVLHRPLYSLMSFDNATFANHLEEKYADVFTNAGVDMVLQGHQHQYTRFCGISSGQCSSQWGFRDIWNKFENVMISPSATSSCFLDSMDPAVASATTTNECRRACNKNSYCTGIQWFVDNKCQLLKCSDISFEAGTVSEYIGSKIFVLSKKEFGKTGPVYVVDGTGGAQFSAQIVNYDSRVRYTDVNKFGYSLLNANSSTLHWQHFHAPSNRLADDVILQK